MTPNPLPPIKRSVQVSWDQATAFAKFTADFAQWWPSHTHSVGGSRVAKVVFEPRVDGLIYEQHVDGRRFLWGTIIAWQPPSRVVFTWHPSREPETAQDVEIVFATESTGTRVTLTASGWERWGEGAKGAHRGYDMGWAHILKVWAGKTTFSKLAVDVLIASMGIIQRLRGGRAKVIANSKGEIPAA